MCVIAVLWRFPHLHRGGRWFLFDVIRTVQIARTLLVAGLLAVGQHLDFQLLILLRFDDTERMPEAFVFHYSCVRDTLVFTEDAVGKQIALPSNLQWPVDEVVELYVLTRKALRKLRLLQDDLPAIVGRVSCAPT